ncbi:quinone-dependent dihydroorotate dehydrogenase [Oscillatoria sp. CS-180]|uniref:quinone-dependent dihydroorotate dehydrogenase n=1 Tax=Oscillatoria sp. CS-180 TaxID=3021720 RepID=UPI002330EEB6|nr:quinone-dependent dihydroorotate dehydrogenase [Oscillatoria sp. CS-180]MDB9525107.1 quinone-dependent dihydroorotate dehydrogenase [Oscillatoria sp. CS-180]
MDWYQHGVRPLLFQGFRTDPEWLHQQTLNLLKMLTNTADDTSNAPQWISTATRNWLRDRCQFSHPCLSQSLWGCTFPNPLGLAAGFDKDGLAAPAWSLLGFGFAELGTVTFHPQSGNPQPRLFRLPRDRAVINRMGFNNQGAAQLSQRLKLYWQEQPSLIPIGINLGKSKVTPLDQAVDDYVQSFRLLKTLGDYFVVNVSSPNTPGLRSLQASENLAPILAALQVENTDGKLLLVKIAPDLDWAAIADVLELAHAHNLAGIIATNTTIRREGLRTDRIWPTGNRAAEETGGLSGAPLRDRATEVIQFLYRKSQGQIPILGVGGIFTAQDAWNKIGAGATLLQVYTGWVYGGPEMVRHVLTGLAQQLERHQIKRIDEAIGQQLPFID